MVTELSQALHNIKREQVFLEVRERTHRMRLPLPSPLPHAMHGSERQHELAGCVLGLLRGLPAHCHDGPPINCGGSIQFAQVGQIYYLNRFFEVRSKV